jgi:hypothetical protein
VRLKPDEVCSILDTLEDVRGKGNILEVLKGLYPHAAKAFILSVIAFDREIQRLSLEKEPVGVVVQGEEWISNILEISEKGLRIEPRTSNQGRGAESRMVSISQVKRWIYE